ncbi:universal stress protein [Halobellus sp. GM3]|uniref:universal stress protein n=1 Tax=Halobellus sp. GM3 TaxID=3458410 RepID=UPI00403DD0AD
MVIVAAVDRTKRAETVIEQANALATAFDDTVHVIHVLSMGEFIDLGRTQAQKREQIDYQDIERVAANIAEEAAEGLTVPYEAIGLVGNPADEVVNYADRQDARYIVVAGRERSPVGKAVFGSVAQSVLLHATCPTVMSTR